MKLPVTRTSPAYQPQATIATGTILCTILGTLFCHRRHRCAPVLGNTSTSRDQNTLCKWCATAHATPSSGSLYPPSVPNHTRITSSAMAPETARSPSATSCRAHPSPLETRPAIFTSRDDTNDGIYASYFPMPTSISFVSSASTNASTAGPIAACIDSTSNHQRQDCNPTPPRSACSGRTPTNAFRMDTPIMQTTQIPA